MLCPACQKSDTRVLDSRDENSFVRRRRECMRCSYRFTTFERLELSRIHVIKRDGRREDYDRTKLYHGIKLALEKRPEFERIDNIILEIEREILATNTKTILSKQIGDIVTRKLKEVDEVAYLRFLSVYKKFSSAKKFQKEAEKLTNQ